MMPVPDSAAPDWAYGADQDVKCPVCEVVTTGLNWVIEGEGEAAHTTGMRFFPCGDVAPTSLWVLEPSGSSGQLRLRRVT